MATALAHNLLKSSSDVEEKDKNGHSAIDFLSKLSSVLASEVPGARRDVESLPWKKLPLIPVTEEIHKPSMLKSVSYNVMPCRMLIGHSKRNVADQC